MSSSTIEIATAGHDSAAATNSSTGPVPITRLDLVWTEPAQRARALAGLVDDGLVARLPGEWYALAGDPASEPAEVSGGPSV